MGKHSLFLGLAGLILSQTGTPVLAQDLTAKQSSKQRLSMLLPKAPPPAIKINASLPVKTATAAPAELSSQINPPAEFASHPQINTQVTGKPIPDNVLQVLIEGASRAEQLSRSYNRRIADAIVWLANSMTESGTFSPVSSPNLHWQRFLQEQPSTRNERSRVTSID